MKTQKRKKCPECGSELDRSEDPTGRAWQCHNPTCLSVFEDGEDLDDVVEMLAPEVFDEAMYALGDRVRESMIGPNGEHLYYSTSCLHDEDHEHCQGSINHAGEVKQAGRCKRCNAMCLCRCHQK